MSAEYNGSEIAIIAMHSRLPGAPDTGSYWDNLRQGECSLLPLSPEQLREAGVPPEVAARPNYVAWAGLMDDIAEFDAEFFDMSPREAEITDVQQRLMLECSAELLERGGYDPERYAGNIGVFAGAAMSSYMFGVLRRPELLESLGELALRHGNDKDFLCSRVSYKLNLRGPSMAIQTSCSSGLVAVHVACQSLLSGETDMAIAGAVSVRVPQTAGYFHQTEGILSRDGRCRPFDHQASGTVFTNGIGLVLLKRLEDAQRDGDQIVAVLKGTAVNNDGAAKVGFSAPSVEGQAAVIADALAVADVDPRQISYIEAHGTGTYLGDPIEFEALRLAYGADGVPCAIGSAKSNVGHLGPAGGIAGLIKAALMLQHRTLVPTANFERCNPAIPMAQTRFHVAQQSAAWTGSGDAPLLAGVSSFGIGGTNAHAVLMEAPAAQPRSVTQRPRVLLLSAKNGEALAAGRERLAAYLGGPDADPATDPMAGSVAAAQGGTDADTLFADQAYTTQVGRRQHGERYAVVAADAAQAVAALRGAGAQAVSGKAKEATCVLLFPGQGSQRIGMAADLYRSCTPFRLAFDEVAALVSRELDTDLKTLLWDEHPYQAQRLKQTAFAQPALFAVEYALARSLITAGLHPAALLGHSLGELTAAAVAGVFTLADAARLVVLRGRLMQSAAPGAMLAVQSAAERVLPLLADGVEIAALNSPRQTVLAGPEAAIDALAARLKADGYPHARLETSHAFHSASMDAVLEEFERAVAACAPKAPQLRMLSNVSGNWLSAEQAMSPAYWASQIRQPVRFADCVKQLADISAGNILLIEAGPGQTLSGLARANQLPPRVQACAVLDGAQGAQAEYSGLLLACARAWTAGADIDWRLFDENETLRRTVLPAYAFQRRRYWIDPVPPLPATAAPAERAVPAGVTAATATGVAVTAASGNGAAGTSAASSAAAPAPATVDYANPIEGVVAALYSEFLGVAVVDPEASFFAMGGNSLVAVQLVARLREMFQVDVPLRGLYQSNSVRAIAALVAEQLIAQGPVT
ncbi:acyltransferase domain-containing protein [Oxalobacteraceae bacterium]|nr:acyltransferase domain-containing protein [Oxalobacteraceae bacterium]